MSCVPRDVLTPREVAERTGFCYRTIPAEIRRDQQRLSRCATSTSSQTPTGRIASWLASRCQICPTTGRYLRVERLPPSAREDRRTVSVASLMLSRPGMRRTVAACPRRAS
jgi:hypothetical protein